MHALRARQSGIGDGERQRLDRIARGYIVLAERHAREREKALLIAHGVSGSGKTSATQSLIEAVGAIRVRSDIERKRLHGLSPLARTGSGLDAGIYSKEATRSTYDLLLQKSGEIVAAGYPVVVDAAFLRRSERAMFRAFAGQLGAGFLILAFDAPHAVLRERVASRLGTGTDASEADLAVLERQRALREPITPEEEACVVRFETDHALGPALWKSVMEQFSAPG